MMRVKVTQPKRIYLSTKDKVGTLPVQGIRDVLYHQNDLAAALKGYSAPRNKTGVESMFTMFILYNRKNARSCSQKSVTNT